MTICFICTGNTCRSPIAEYYLNSLHLPGVFAVSRGIFATGSPISESSKIVLAEMGIDAEKHISKSLSRDDLKSDLFIAMSHSHKDALISVGIDPEKIIVLGDGINDPYGMPLTQYRICRDKIKSEINKLVFGGFIFGFSVEKASADDIKSMAALEKECFSSPWSENSLLDSFNSKTEFFVAKQKDKIIGYAGLTAVAGEGYITNIAVTNKERKKGVGSLLTCRLIISAQKKQLDFISLEVRKSNEKAQSIYKNQGFKQVGLRKNFYTLPTEDAIIMTVYFKKEEN